MLRLLRGFQTAFSVGIAVVMGTALFLQGTLPDKYYIVEGESLNFSSAPVIPLKTSYSGSLAEEAYAYAGNSYTVDLSFLGGVRIKAVGVEVIDATTVILGGTPFGIKMFTDGVLVVGLSEVLTTDGLCCPAKQSGLCEGDILHTIDGTQVRTNEEVAEIISSSDGRALTVSYTRGGVADTLLLTPREMADGTGYRAGLWVRDSSAGIGTMTFYDPSSRVFAGLGHAVCDVDTGEIMPLMSGEIVGAAITGVVKGEKGSPGELRGIFLDGSSGGGILQINSETGVYGCASEQSGNGALVPVALKQEIREGPAVIYSTVNGSGPQEYDIIIEKISLSDRNPTKNMVIRVTDSELLELTGGIVQGMSGSPILQNGKLIGAVTHVFVNDPACGYGISIEKMLETAKNVNISDPS